MKYIVRQAKDIVLKNVLYLFSALILLCSCSKEDEKALYFVGDSMIANWDVETAFPNRVTRNFGQDGSHISYLDAVKVMDTNADVVVLIGTNDLHASLSEAELLDYCDTYEEKVSRIGGSRILVLSVLPTSDREKNSVINKFNDEMRQRLKEHTDVIYVDCYDVFIDETGVLREDLSRDGLHLNDYGYILLGDRVKRFL